MLRGFEARLQPLHRTWASLAVDGGAVQRLKQAKRELGHLVVLEGVGDEVERDVDSAPVSTDVGQRQFSDQRPWLGR